MASVNPVPPARDPLAGKIPVTLITGFLGSGKTTLISRLVVPYVKAAVMDRQLFQHKTHPARRLLTHAHAP